MEKSYLYKRHNVYWVRVRVPDKVRDIVGKAQFSRNLSTKDLSEANRKKHIVIAEFKQRIHFAEKQIDGTFASLSKEDQIRELALESRASSKDNSEDLDFILTDIIEHKVSELYGEKESNAIFNSHHPEWKGGNPNPKAVKATQDSFKIINPNYEPISIVAKAFLSERVKDLKTSTFKRKEGNINNFIRWFGNSEIKDITKKNAGEYVTHLMHIKNPAPATIRNIVVDISSLFNWAEGRGYIDKNPFQKLDLPKNKNSHQSRRPWKDEHLMLFLQSKYINRNAFVATVLAMYSGMRIEEICVMQNKNIEDKCFHIEKGKTKASSRVIPVHPIIQSIIDSLRASSKDEFLIKGINSGGYDDKRSWNFQKKLGRLRDKIGMPDGVVFHSLRNTFATRMENLGIPTNHINQLMGHKHNNMSLDVYSAGMKIEPLVESINKLTYGKEIDSFIKSNEA
jgi:integrase